MGEEHLLFGGGSSASPKFDAVITDANFHNEDSKRSFREPLPNALLLFGSSTVHAETPVTGDFLAKYSWRFDEDRAQIKTARKNQKCTLD